MTDGGTAPKETRWMRLCRRRGWMTCALVAIVLCVWLLTRADPGRGEMSYAWLGLSRQGFCSFKVWQLLTHGVMHGSWLHVAMNALLLLLVGFKVERIAGGKGFVGVLLAGVLLGGVLHLLLSPAILIGASGGLMALLLFYCTLSPDSKCMVPFRLSARNLGRGLLTGSLILAAIDPAAGLPLFEQIGRQLQGLGLASVFKASHACHLGGGLAGWLAARWVLRPRVSLERLQLERAKREG